ncbi:MAG: redoxin domain-containing protein [Clostridia bacterium]|nr:redoxin domain-containing protein [Clostridia bacterium]
MIAFAKSCTYFKNINTELLGLSIDSNSSHLAWVYDIYCRTGVKIPFPIISDRSGEIARKYGMISNNISNTQTVRNVYVIDANGIIRLILIYPLNIGRFIPEILRAVNAMQVADSNKAAIPANWVPCQPIINPSPNTVCEMEERVENINQNGSGMNWYLTFKNPEKCNETISDNCTEDKCEIKCVNESTENKNCSS